MPPFPPLVTSVLLVVVCVLALAGCGDASQESTAQDPTAQEPTVQRSQGQVSLVAVLSQSGVGGRVQQTATALAAPGGLAVLLRDVRAGALRLRVRREVARATVPDGQRLMGAVVSVGCDVPVGVEASYVGGTLHLTPTYRGDRHQECFVAVTSVALVLAAA